MGKVARPYPSGHLRLYKTKRQKAGGAALPVQMEYVVHSCGKCAYGFRFKSPQQDHSRRNKRSGNL